MKGGIVREFVEQIEGLDVSCRQSRRLAKALRAIDILALIEARQESRIPTQHRDFEVWFFAFRHLASPVRRDRIKHEGGKIRACAQQLLFKFFACDTKGGGAL